MEQKLSIKVNIANRIYPLKIDRHEEEGVRKAAKLINEKVKQFENDFAVKDKQDLLAMCALQFATEANEKISEVTSSTSSSQEKARRINDMITEFLDETLVR